MCGLFIMCALDNDYNSYSIYCSKTAPNSSHLSHKYNTVYYSFTCRRHQFTTTKTHPKFKWVPHVTCRAWIPSYTMYMCVVFMGTDYFLKHSQNTQILCYAKQFCFPNKLYFMTEPAEQGLDRVSLSESNEPWSLFLSPVYSVSSTGPLKTHLVSFDTTNVTNTADPNHEPTLDDDGK